ncbi:MAG: aldehyde dehydrogenase family protein [bacterium]|nr:aldehyde dehydrogenase family protein [bacterium]
MANRVDADLAALAEARAKAIAARAAFEELAGAPQERLDAILRQMARAGTAAAEELARLAVEETGYGVYEHKILKNRYNTTFVAKYMLRQRAVGVLWVDEASRMTAVGCPMGVIAGLIPRTNPTSTVLFKALAAVKSGNAIVFSPHPRAVQCCARTTEVVAEAAVKAGAPRGLISCLQTPTLASTQELMGHPAVSLVLATGSGEMVRVCYSSGKPTIAVGAGNVPVYIHRSVPDLREAALMVVESKSFDNGTACVAEQAIILDEPIADQCLEALADAGMALLEPSEHDALRRVIFDERGGLRADPVGQSAVTLGGLCGIAVPVGTRVLGVRLDTVGAHEPLSAEILGPVLKLYRSPTPEAAYDRCLEVLRFGGEGHTLGLHAADVDVIERFSSLPASRFPVNTPTLFGGMGYSADIDPSFMLGTGTWSGSISSDNITPLHLVNIKRIAHEVRPWRQLAADTALPP